MWKTFNEALKIEVSDGGEIRRDGQILPKHDLNKYEGVYFFGCHYYVHRLVAELFCEKKEGRNVVDHIDGNKKNNKASNLRWVNNSENLKYAFEQGLRPRTTKALLEHIEKQKIKVAKYKNGVKLKEYESYSEASKDVGVDSSGISRAVNGYQKTSGGFEWRKV